MGRGWIAFCLCLLWPGAAAAQSAEKGWHEASTRHFLVYAEGSAENAHALAEKLERFDAALRRLRLVPDHEIGAANRLTVFQLDDVSDIESLAGRNGVAGFYSGQASGSHAFVPRRTGAVTRGDITPEAVLFHEYAHHFMLANFPGAFPAWFVEGYAEFHATAEIAPDGTVKIGEPPLYRAFGLANKRKLSLPAMLSGKTGKLSSEQVEAMYGRGWLLLHLLTFEPARRGQLDTYLKGMDAGLDPVEAAKQAFGDLRTLERELDDYLNRRRMNVWSLRPTDAPAPAVAVRRLSGAEAAIMPVRIRSKRGVDAKRAAKVVAMARKVAAEHANSALVQVSLAEAEYDAGEFARAEAAADAALRLDPKRTEAMIYKGMARMAALKKAGNQDPAAWSEVRRLFGAANRLDPEDPEPLVLFYRAFLEQGTKPTPNAVEGLTYAMELAPQDGELRMNVARQHLIDGKGPEAKAALGPVAFAPHGGEQAEFARAVVDAIDAGGAAAALALFTAAEKKAEASRPGGGGDAR